MLGDEHGVRPPTHASIALSRSEWAIASPALERHEDGGGEALRGQGIEGCRGVPDGEPVLAGETGRLGRAGGICAAASRTSRSARRYAADVVCLVEQGAPVPRPWRQRSSSVR